MSVSRYSVLVVDDEYYLGQILAQALQKEKFESIAVTDVDQAIDWLGRKNFDLVVSDIYLPGKSGIDLFHYAKKKHAEVPFIFMTGVPNLQMAVDLLTQGGYDYIVKPFAIPDFIQKIKNVITTARKEKAEKKLVEDLKSVLTRRLDELIIYHDIFQSTDDGLIITDVEGNIVKVNRGFEKITGLTNPLLIGQSLSILQKTVLPGLSMNQIVEKLNQKIPWSKELIGKRLNGEQWYASITFSPIFHEDSEPFAFAGLIRDVSEQRRVEEALISSLQKMNQAQEAIIFALAKLAENRDDSTGYHLERICEYSEAIARALLERKMFPKQLNEDFIKMLYRTAPIHDIGKVGIPDYILLKKGRLTEPEFAIMRTHVNIGYNILNSIAQRYGDMPFLRMGIEITYCHHERWDGSGYPRGLKGNKIPLSAQIVAIADVYDALTTERTYKDAYSHKFAIELMKRERGKHFAPRVLDVFLDIADRIREIQQKYQQQAEELAAVRKQIPMKTYQED